MACFHPLQAWQLESGEVIFVERGNVRRALLLPCGQCSGCRLERSRQWAVRVMHEASLHDSNSFVTLTYDDQHLPDRGLRYRDFQLFMKRLRKCVGPVRFYMCGEYGEQTHRPHFHAVLFGVGFSDRTEWRTSSAGFQLYRSKLLESVWSDGSSEIGDVTFESAAYVARYCMDKVTGPRAAAHYERLDESTGEIYSLTPEFNRMSLKPGIGYNWYKMFYRSDVLPRDKVIVRGVECPVPRYYDKMFAMDDFDLSDALALSREKRVNVEDTTPARLAVREHVTKARLSFKKRNSI